MRTHNIYINFASGHKDLFIRSCLQIWSKENLYASIPTALTYIIVTGTVAHEVIPALKRYIGRISKLTTKDMFFDIARNLLPLFTVYIANVIMHDGVLRGVPQKSVEGFLFKTSAFLLHTPGLSIGKMIQSTPSFLEEVARISPIAFSYAWKGISAASSYSFDAAKHLASFFLEAGTSTFLATRRLCKVIFDGSVATLEGAISHAQYCYEQISSSSSQASATS